MQRALREMAMGGSTFENGPWAGAPNGQMSAKAIDAIERWTTINLAQVVVGNCREQGTLANTPKKSCSVFISPPQQTQNLTQVSL